MHVVQPAMLQVRYLNAKFARERTLQSVNGLGLPNLRREHANDENECAGCAALFTVAILVLYAYNIYTCTFLCTYIHSYMTYNRVTVNIVTWLQGLR